MGSVLRHRQHSSLAALRQTPEASHLTLQVHSVSLSLLSGRGVSTCRALQVRHTADTRKCQSCFSTTGGTNQQLSLMVTDVDAETRKHSACIKHMTGTWPIAANTARALACFPFLLARRGLRMGLVIEANHLAPFISTVSNTITSFTPGWLTGHTPADQLQSLSLVNLTKETFLNVITYFSVLFTFFPLTSCVVDADGFFGCQTR